VAEARESEARAFEVGGSAAALKGLGAMGLAGAGATAPDWGSARAAA
jgi:hypothetical protein